VYKMLAGAVSFKTVVRPRCGVVHRNIVLRGAA